MGKFNVFQRVTKILKDAETKEVDFRKRWAALAEDYDVPGLREALAACGPMPVATLDDVPRPRAVQYAGRDADATLRLHPHLDVKVRDMGLLGVEEVDLNAIPMINRMQRRGVAIDPHHLQRLGEKMTMGMAREVSTIEAITGIPDLNPNSGDQVARLLFDQLKLPIRAQTKSKLRGSTDDKTLESLRSAHPVVPHICDYREMSKIRDAFATVLPRLAGADNRVRCTLRVTRVSSGRIAASSPNLMAQPTRTELGREVRAGFVAAPGYEFGDWDLDQIEMRVMADLSGDETMCKLFIDGKEDMHTKTAMWIFGIKNEKDVDKMKHRYPAKRVGFGVINGIAGKGLKEQLELVGIMGYSESDCDNMILEWFKMYRGVRSFMEECRAECRRFGYVRDQWGRIRYLPGIHSADSWIREEAERQSHSHKIQGGAQGILKRAMGDIWKYVLPKYADSGESPSWGVEPVLQIHDELLMEVHDSVSHKDLDDEMQEAMCSAVRLKVPLKAAGGYGMTWADAH